MNLWSTNFRKGISPALWPCHFLRVFLMTYWNIDIYFSLIYLSINSFGACSSCGNVTDLCLGALTSIEERSPFSEEFVTFHLYLTYFVRVPGLWSAHRQYSYLGSNRRLVIYWLMLRSCAISWSTSLNFEVYLFK